MRFGSVAHRSVKCSPSSGAREQTPCHPGVSGSRRRHGSLVNPSSSARNVARLAVAVDDEAHPARRGAPLRPGALPCGRIVEAEATAV
jgi:hypothetical protein